MKSEDFYSFNVNKGLNKTLHNYRSMTVCHISLIKSKANNVMMAMCNIALIHSVSNVGNKRKQRC